MDELTESHPRPVMPTVASSADGFEQVPLAACAPNPRQPRVTFDEDELGDLADSIRAVGVLQPIVVRPVGDGFEIIMGERRVRAARRAGLVSIPALIRETTDADLLRDALVENIQRAPLNSLEEAAAYRALLDETGGTQQDVADMVGRSRAHVANTVRLLQLPPLVQRRLAAGVLSAGHARALLSLQDPALMETVAQRIVAEGLSVRGTEELVAHLNGSGATRPPRRPATAPQEYTDVAERLAEAFETRVRVQGSAKRGRVIIEFASPDDLDRIMQVMHLPEAGH